MQVAKMVKCIRLFGKRCTKPNNYRHELSLCSVSTKISVAYFSNSFFEAEDTGPKINEEIMRELQIPQMTNLWNTEGTEKTCSENEL
jgi:hypothetical protein